MHADIADVIADTAQNSIEAGARNVWVSLVEDGETVSVTIRDDGKGMDEDTRKRAFDPFFTEAGKHDKRRVGLGLPILKQICEACDGAVSLVSEKGAGTTLAYHFAARHIDLPPMGDIGRMVVTLFNYPGEFELTFTHRRGEEEYMISRSELSEAVGGLDTVEGISLAREFMAGQEEALPPLPASALPAAPRSPAGPAVRLALGAFAAFLSAAAFGFDCSPQARAKARDFIANEKPFHLGFLPTECSNPITATLEEDFRRSTLAGVQCLQRADRQVPITMRHVFAGAAYARLVDSMVATLRAPRGRIIFSGCGATGRLSILLESVWRDFFFRRAAELTPAERALADRSASIMTGGDFALIKSVESFEDSALGGERQAEAMAVGEGDTFVAITEGGETSSVLGTLRSASRHGARCFLVFNNPADLLRANLERCREAIDNPKVTVIDLYCGSMGVAGSTRMQATTSEQLLGSVALETALCILMPRFAKETAPDPTLAFERMLSALETPEARADIAGAIAFEKGLYARGGKVTYFADDCMLDLFTDTTERSPTFMLPPFRPVDEAHLAQSWAFVKNPLHATSACWEALFHRAPRCLAWTRADYAVPGMPPLKGGALPKITLADLMKYPVGCEETPARTANGPSAAVIVRAGAPRPAFERAAREQAARFGEVRLFAVRPVADSPLEVWKHLAVKLTFNNLSTGTMVAMGRVSGNWMSWVSISNKKLIDRGIRLIAELGRVPYAEAAERLFAAEEWVEGRDWTGRETPCAVQVALKELEKEQKKEKRK